MSCDLAASESKKIMLLCYKMQQGFSDNSKERRELKWLTNEISINIAKFTAAEFFEINRNTFFGILSTTTTYLIIIIQFNI
ncbi:hypothetical protein BDFB_014701 [Asbolus verrucosus]|uniref:7tm 7 domain containing protein n=1 Tax=Asbolus verrucosus TaxID=1661398 RepID=A0A482VCH2_ASBVE|nr:hypothetical protein BDFB_014701 [Asbolus verrucosus]